MSRVVATIGAAHDHRQRRPAPTSDTCTPAWRADWRNWIEQRWHDPLAARLYALWVGLCQLVADGELTDQESHDLFRIASQRIIEQRAREQRSQGKGGGL